MTPTPITVPLTSPGVPVTFILNGTGELEVKSVVATFDGSGAAGEFDAVCSVYTQDDKLISRTKPASSIAAGASAVVTFAPFLRKAATAAPAGGGVLQSYNTFTSDSNQSISSGSETAIAFGSGAFSGAYLDTADHIQFTLQPGLWLILAQVKWHPLAVIGAGVLQLAEASTEAKATIPYPGGAADNWQQLQAEIYFTGGVIDVVFTAFQNTGSAIRLPSGDSHLQLQSWSPPD